MTSEKYTIPITMLGPTGVGKTSLLAAMYRKFAHTTGTTDLDLTPEGTTPAKIREAGAQLARLSRQVIVTEGVRPTGASDIQQFHFGVGRKNKTPRFTLRFTDYAGELLLETGGALLQRVSEQLDLSPVIILAIDAPALMYADGAYHEEVNLPEQMYEIVKRIMQRDDRHRLLILVPLKSELYLETPEGTRALVDRIHDGYKSLLAHLSHPEVQPRIGTVVVPVQTTGTIRFSSVQDTPEGPAFRYVSRALNAQFDPVDAEQPLRFGLRFAINVYRRERRGAFRKTFDWLKRTDPALLKALDAFSSVPPASPGIQVLQSHPHLTNDDRSRR